MYRREGRKIVKEFLCTAALYTVYGIAIIAVKVHDAAVVLRRKRDWMKTNGQRAVLRAMDPEAQGHSPGSQRGGEMTTFYGQTEHGRVWHRLHSVWRYWTAPPQLWGYTPCGLIINEHRGDIIKKADDLPSSARMCMKCGREVE